MNEEVKLQLADASIQVILEKLAEVKSPAGAIEKKEVAKIYRHIKSANVELVKHFLVQDFFFLEADRIDFDYRKIVLFNLLYSDTEDSNEVKAAALFDLIDSQGIVEAHSKGLLDALLGLAHISTVAMADVLTQMRRFEGEQDEEEFLELQALFSTNANMLREFALHLQASFLFPVSFNASQSMSLLS